MSPMASWIIEWCEYVSHRWPDVLEAHKRTQGIAPGFWYLDTLSGAAYRELGDYPAAVREYEGAAKALGGAPQYGLAITYARMGRYKEGRDTMRRLDELATRQYVPLCIARLYTGHSANWTRASRCYRSRSTNAKSC